MPPNSKRPRNCPACGWKLASDEQTCSQCGKVFTKDGKKRGTRKNGPSKTPKIACPSCGALVSKRAKKCPACKASLKTGPDKVVIKPIDIAKAEPGEEVVARETSEAMRDEEKKTEELATPAEPPPVPETASLVEDHLETTEPIAPVESKPEEELHPAKVEDLIAPEPVTPLTSEPVGVAPATGEEEKKASETVAPVEVAIAATSPEATAEESKRADLVAPIVPEAVQEQPASVSELPDEESKSCQICGAKIPKHFEKCPICFADLTESAPQPGKVLPALAPPEVQAPEEFVAPVQAAETAAQSPGRSRKLKSAKVTTVPVMDSAKSAGRTNGISLVNGQGKASGRGMVNGTGAVNGTSFVNGTGISNGIGPRKAKTQVKRKRRLTGVQVVVVVLAIAVVVSAFMFLSNPDETERYSIDGDFSDWNDATIYGTRMPSAAPSSNITEWAVATQESDLYLYFETQEPMMSSTEPESYYLFVDADGLNSTGYAMESIGADYMLQMTGWNDTVKSSQVSRYSSQSDHFNWTAWASGTSLSYSKQGARIESRANLQVTLGNASRFVLLSMDSMGRGALSYAAPLRGAVLLVQQIPSQDVELDGLVSQSTSVEMLKIRFTSEGGSGRVDQVDPRIVGATMTAQVPSFSLAANETRDVNIVVDTLASSYGDLVSAEVIASSIVSSYDCVEIWGPGASAYVGSPPAGIVIDGAFADWDGMLSVDLDTIPVTYPNLDIDKIGNVSDSDNSFFYVGVEGDMCSGTHIPAVVVKPSGSGGGGATVVQRRTAEDVLRIFIDSDRSVQTGELVVLDSKQIGADQMIEVKGLYGRITSTTEFNYSGSGSWDRTTDQVKAAKDSKRIEISVTSTSLAGSVDIDFIVETTSWKDRGDRATFDPASTTASMMTWIVDSNPSSRYATSMSYQRKMFYDGINYWSFFFNGANTVYKYSLDEGKTWSYSGLVFTTPGVNETSIWYDSSTDTVYAVGDTSTATNRVLVQAGTVDAAGHTISWAAMDSNLRTSTNPMAGKNTFISMDLNGYLWVLSSNMTRLKPLQHDLSAFKSAAVHDISSWVNTGEILPYGEYFDNSKGSIVPAGSGSDMWAIYAYEGFVAAKKYVGTWPEIWNETFIYNRNKKDNWNNTDNSPPSVVVDGKGVVHVVYGTGFADGIGRSAPRIEYSHSNPDLTFTAGLNLDPSNSSLSIGNYFPTISLETSTDNLYVLWLQSDTTLTPKTMMGRKCISGTWTTMVIEPQTTYTKLFLTSIYSVSGEYKICWQWTQNVTIPIDVMFDGTMIPEFTNLALPMIGILMLFGVFWHKSRSKNKSA